MGFYDDGPPPLFARWGIRSVLIPDEVRKCVVFIGSKQGDRFQPKASAFLATYEDHDLRFMYLVTAEHVVSGMITKNLPLYCRINLVNGDVAVVPVPYEAWRFHPDERQSSDIAACHIGEFAVAENGETVPFDCRTVCVKGRTAISGTDSVMAERGIGVGEEIFITGLFRSHFGSEKNVPILRVGNIAMLKSEPVLTRYKGFIEAHLVEARSIGGLSGSPVFVHLPPFRFKGGNIQVPEPGKPVIYLLGLVHVTLT